MCVCARARNDDDDGDDDDNACSVCSLTGRHELTRGGGEALTLLLVGLARAKQPWRPPVCACNSST